MIEPHAAFGLSRLATEEQTPWLTSRLSGHRQYRVGEPFRSGRTVWPQETFYGIDRDGYLLTLFRTRIATEDREACGRGPVELALIVEEPLAVLAYRFGDAGQWDTIPYAWPLSTGRQGRFVPPARIASGACALLWVSLVNAETGLIEAQRGLVLNPEFTLLLNQAIRRQAREPFDAESYVRAIATLHASLPSASGLVQRAVARSSHRTC